MADYIVKNMPYDELVQIVEELRAKHTDDTPDYLENDPAKNSYIRNRLFYEDGKPEATFTPFSYDFKIDESKKAGLATTDVIKDADRVNYSVSIEMSHIISGNFVIDDTIEMPFDQMTESKYYSKGKLVGCKYSASVGAVRWPVAEIYVVYDAPQFLIGRHLRFPTNGVYLIEKESVITETHGGKSHTTKVTGLTRLSTLKIHRIDNKFIDLDRNKTFLELKKRVEEGGIGSTVEKIASIDTYFNDVMSYLRYTPKGITWTGEFMIASAESEMAQGTILHKMPLVAGENITFETVEYEGTPTVQVNAETPSWDGLQDKPFGENFTIKETISAVTFEGEPHTIKFNNGLGNWEAYRQSEKIYTKEQLLGGKVSATYEEYIIDESCIVEDTADGLKLQFLYGGYVWYYIWVAYTTNYQPEGFDAPFPAVGLYFSSWEAEGGQETVCVYRVDLEYIGIKKLDNKYLDLPKNEDFKELKNSIPTVPTNVSEFTNDANYVNETQLINKVSEIVANAPEDFDTLKEMSDWIASHRDSASQMNSDISSNTDRISTLEGYLGTEIVTTRGTGTAYVATVPSITELKRGVSFLLTPHTNNTANYATLNVNGLGEKYIFRKLSSGSGVSYFGRKDFFVAGLIYRVRYDYSGWVLSDYAIPDATDLSGVVPTENGGVPTTSADNAGKVLTTNESGVPEWQTPSGSNENSIFEKTVCFEDNCSPSVSYSGNGIGYSDTILFRDENDEVLKEINYLKYLPIAAGENVAFEVDEENQVVKVNATGGTSDIVVPAEGSRGNANFVESIPGLVKLYNQSAGLGIDEYGQLGIVAATESDINEGTSMRKPIVPKTMKTAMQKNSFAGDLNNITPTHEDAYTPAGALAITNFVLENAHNFKLYKIPRGGMFEIKPGMMALVLPYGDYTLSLHESETSSAKVSNMGATVVMATDWGADPEDGNCFWVACMSAKTYKVLGVEIPTMGSNHTKYTQNCYIKNNDTGTSGTGYAYVYYISRG